MNLYVWVKWIGNSIWQMIWSINTRGLGHVFKCLITEMSTENGVALPTSVQRFRLFLFYVCSLASFSRELLGHTSSRIRSIFSFCASLITLARTTLQKWTNGSIRNHITAPAPGHAQMQYHFLMRPDTDWRFVSFVFNFLCYCRYFTAFLDVFNACCFCALIYLFIDRKFSFTFFF